jgi:hypothetical protein
MGEKFLELLVFLGGKLSCMGNALKWQQIYQSYGKILVRYYSDILGGRTS